MTSEFEKKILESTGRAITEKDKLVVIAVDILTGLGYGTFIPLAQSKIRQIPDKQVHAFVVHIREVLA